MVKDAAQQETPKIDIAIVSDALLGTWKKERIASRSLASQERFQNTPGQSMQEHREDTLKRLAMLVEEGAIQRAFPKEYGGEDNHGGNLAAFAELVFADPSLQIKSGVQWGLFGSAILHLGTKHHHDLWLRDVLELKIPGAFAMTEIGHGSDVASVATTATYIPETEEFEIHTPFAGAWKEFLGNAALHGQAAVVFAQLITKGVNHGVHAFYVPIRDENLQLLPGVDSFDDGFKGGLNGIDNGRLAFDHVRIPRTNLLNRYGDVDAAGNYSSPIASPGRRFFTMLGTLVQGRVSLDGAAVNAMKLGLATAITYANERRQFPGADGKESLLLDYGLHQRRLLPRLAQTFAMQFAHERLLHVFDEVFSGKNDSDENRESLETLAAALKPLSTWAALDTLQETREACGGAGFIAKNRMVTLRQDLDIYATFEGDNHVLLQLVGKRLLADYAKSFADGGRDAIVNAAKTQIVDRLSRFGLRQAVQDVTSLGQTARAVNELQDPNFQQYLLTDRIETMISEIAQALREGKKAGGAAGQAQAFNDNQAKLIAAARAHGELLQWESFTDALAQFEGDTLTVMTWLRDLFAFSIIERDAAWFLRRGRISGARYDAMEAYVTRLLGRLRLQADDLVKTFGLTKELVRAEIFTGIEAERQAEAMAYVAEKKAAGEWPVSEKTLKK
ncbi:acyl-CoA dehydrogenase [Canibacter zhoujuaniae]|uniref:acyl-CoA dehydrogenase family protein n=1 Tax=Canibacter zhoujuaniae TaxID=2708343 RepID=UPI00141D8936|nr:acyl-CoA dehydrogenase [Canibacter zhoujuaniae]